MLSLYLRVSTLTVKVAAILVVILLVGKPQCECTDSQSTSFLTCLNETNDTHSSIYLYSHVLLNPAFQRKNKFSDKKDDYCDSPSDLPFDLSCDQLMSLVRLGDIQLFDVRTREEVSETGMIPKATNLPLDEIEEAFQLSPEEFQTKYGVKMPEKHDENIILNCLAGCRSLEAMEALHNLGYRGVRHFPGGWEEYEQIMMKL